MNSQGFAWESLLSSDAVANGRTLKAALFTTYDRADDVLLAEHLLPYYLQISREPDGEGLERKYFLMELSERLKQLHSHLVIVSSTVQEENSFAKTGESGTYNWIWHFIRQLTVGRNGPAVQHAKLWLLHWGTSAEDDSEYLEIVISSANLTRSAFKGQLQAVWRSIINLRSQGSMARLAQWGMLHEFIKELAESTGDLAPFIPFLALLSRVECPAGISFVASVPGKYTRSDLRFKPWGAAGLASVAPGGRGTVNMAVLSPYVGSWNQSTLERWCSRFGGSPLKTSLVWIDRNHPWAFGEKWVMPQSSLGVIKDLQVTMLKLRYEPGRNDQTDLFHENHNVVDDRWCHAKIYKMQCGKSVRLLVTSANFSTAAWGSEDERGTLDIKNFELGVCLQGIDWPFNDLQEFSDTDDAATVNGFQQRLSARIQWARAVWNGTLICIECRCADGCALSNEILVNADIVIVPVWLIDKNTGLYSAETAWADIQNPPGFVQLTSGDESVSVAVFDERPLQAQKETVPSEIDPQELESIRDALLFEQYGGMIASETEDADQVDNNSPDSITGDTAADSPMPVEAEGSESGLRDSYAVPSFELARRYLQIVDRWVNRAKHALKLNDGEFELKILKRDGEQLIEAFNRQAGRDEKKGSAHAIGARLAAEELAERLNRFGEVSC